MAVLMNSYTYSAAEFFAAALEEYEWAFTVGQQTVGKGNFQVTIPLSDGSAVALSVGRYYTPIKGIRLEDVGGLTPNIPVEVDEETEALIYSGLLDPMEDPQVLAALEALK
jgi:carboxyl-terminal processing protease